MNKKTLTTIVLVCFFGLVVTASASHAPTNLVIVKNSAKTVTIGWAAVPGVTGYGLFVDGTRVSTAGAAATQAKFGTPQYRRYVLGVSALKTGGATSTITVEPRWVAVAVDIPPEPTPAAVCADGLDNDGDGKVDLADPGCSSATDNDETDTPTPSPTCTLQATPSNFAAQVSAASAGQTVCLASGNYGQFTGVSKAITIRAATGASPQMTVSLGSGDSGFTLDGMTGMSGVIRGASNVTIRNSTFTGSVDFEGGAANVNVVFDHNTHNWNAVYTGGLNAKLFVGSGQGTLANPSITIKNSEIRNGDLDGIHFGNGAGYQILNNTMTNICDVGTNHSDFMQFDTSVVTQTRIAGNFVQAPFSCGTQGITSYDHGTNGVIIENNLVDIRRPWGIELYSDVNSIVRHNTVVYYPGSQCFFNTPCGRIGLDRKSAQPAGVGTQVYDNLAVADFANGSTGTADHNVSGNGAIFVGPLTTHDGFLLSPTSPVGRGAARDGSNAGVYAIP